MTAIAAHPVIDPAATSGSRQFSATSALKQIDELREITFEAILSALPSAIVHTQAVGHFVRSIAASALEARTETPVADRTDEQLLSDHLGGDAKAFPELVERYRNELLHFLIRFLGSRSAAEDVFQDAFLQVHLAADSFDSSRRFKPWLYTIAANKARDFHRRQKRRAAASLSAPVGGDDTETEFVDLLASDEAGPDQPVSDQEQATRVKRIVDELPAHYREILLLSYFQKMSYGQIADSLDIPLGTVKSRLHSAVASFADSWKNEQALAERTEPSS